jgi:hypothetical protein
MGGLAFLLGLGFLAILVCLAVIGLLAGALIGAVLGALTGGAVGAARAPQDKAELATYRGITGGSCLGALAGLVVAAVLVAVAWHYFVAT